jgi:DNA-binding response OmpR family regulator
MRVLLVEDDEMIGRTIGRSLRDDGYALDWVRDGAAAISAINALAQGYALVLLDWMIPRVSGVEVLRKIRGEHIGLPVLMISARDTVEDRVQGLDSGADDYLIKPFSLDELRARIRCLLRRATVRSESFLGWGPVRMDVVTRCVEYNGILVELTAREFALLRAMLEEPGAVLSRSQLEERIYGWGEDISSNAVEFLIHGLRRKLSHQLIENIRGAGWRIRKQA